MTNTLILIVFIVGYLAVVTEHKIHINKTATVLLMAVICWVLLTIEEYSKVIPGVPTRETIAALGEHLQGIAQIVLFLMGAMTIVQLIDSHNGFRIITDFIRTKSKRKLLWVISFLTFFLSPVLDNLTTAIVMVSILHRLIHNREDRLIFSSMVIIAANAGGAWSPIGDITTTMLWIGERLSTTRMMLTLFIPSLVSMVVPLVYFSFLMKSELVSKTLVSDNIRAEPGARRILCLGVGALIFVPIFRAMTNLPPFMGMIAGLGAIWVLTDLMHREEREHLKVPYVFRKIDFSSILFFLGILLAVAALETAGILKSIALGMDQYFRNKDIIATILGLLSAIIDNVPLTAATMGMYDLSSYPTDSKIWELLAYSVGTGGSILIIGSAAGVVVMGMEKINFFWYLKKISFPTLVGYFAGIFSYLGIYRLLV